MPQTKEREAAERTAPAYSYASLLVHVEPGLSASRRVEAAARLARAFDAKLIGLGAEALDAGPVVDPFMGYATAEWVTLAAEQIAADLKNAEAAFRRDAAGTEIEWRSVQDFPARAMARAARAADLIVVSAGAAGASAAFRKPDAGELVITAGRPVLVTPQAGGHLQAKRIVIAWKDTREARRAVADAMPFLVRAEDVIVQAVCADDQLEAAVFQTNDVVQHLKRHGVSARANVTTGSDETVAAELERMAELNQADLIVAGGYGHNRMAEWAFGGVTRDLLWDPKRFVLLSH